MRPPTTTGLYWSIRGEVACGDHTPDFADARWRSEAWAPVPEASSLGREPRYQCQHCALDGRAIVTRRSEQEGRFDDRASSFRTAS
jgi:hypothetical protein